MIVLCCPDGFPGVKQFFKGMECNLEGFKWYSNKELLNCGETFSKLFLGSWDNSYIDILEKLKGQVDVYFTWHSPFLQTALSGEQGKLAWLFKLLVDKKASGLILADLRLYKYFKDLYPDLNLYYLPLLMDTRDLDEVIFWDQNCVSFFGPDAPRKNPYAQLLAGIKIERDTGLVFQTNVYVEDDLGDLPGINLKRTSRWLERRAYLELASKTRIGLCVTCSESFNYNLWEYLYFNGKVVTTVDQLKYILDLCSDIGITSDTTSFIGVADVNDPHSIAEKAIKLHHHEGGPSPKEFVKSFNMKAISRAQDLVTQIK